MIRTNKRLQTLAISLSALGGFVDALGFLKLGGFFVAFMSGNSTRMSVGLAEGSRDFAIAGGLIAVFVIGVIFGSVVAHLGHTRRRTWVLVVVTSLLAAGAMLDRVGPEWASIGAIVLAMGAVNAVFQKDGEVSIGLTYMTGTLVKMGQRMASVFMGGKYTDWIPYFGLWCGLAAGAALGAAMYPIYGFGVALWFATIAAGLLAVITLWLPAEDI